MFGYNIVRGLSYQIIVLHLHLSTLYYPYTNNDVSNCLPLIHLFNQGLIANVISKINKGLTELTKFGLMNIVYR